MPPHLNLQVSTGLPRVTASSLVGLTAMPTCGVRKTVSGSRPWWSWGLTVQPLLSRGPRWRTNLLWAAERDSFLFVTSSPKMTGEQHEYFYFSVESYVWTAVSSVTSWGIGWRLNCNFSFSSSGDFFFPLKFSILSEHSSFFCVQWVQSHIFLILILTCGFHVLISWLVCSLRCYNSSHSVLSKLLFSYSDI